MRKEHLWPILALTAIFIWCLRPIEGFDIWFYIEYGRLVVEEMTIPWSESFLGTTDTYAFHRHANHSWLAYAVCYLAYKFGQLGGLVLLKSLLFTTTAGVTYYNCRLSGLSASWSSLLVMLGVWSVRSRFLLRSVLFTDLLLALLLLFLLRSQQREDGRFSLWGLATLMALWSNTHQGVLAGCFLLFWWLLTRKFCWKFRLQALFVAGFSTLIRPYGWWFPHFFLEHFGNTTAVQDVMEWAPLSFPYMVTHLGPLILLYLVSVPWAAKVHKASLGNAFIALLFLVLALRSQRAVGEILPVVVPLLAGYISCLSPSRKLLVPAIAGICIFFYTGGPNIPNGGLFRLDPKYPRGLVQALPEDHGQIFNSYEFGNFLIFQEKRPFIHGITALYAEPLVTDFQAALNRGPKREELFEQFQVEEVMLHHPTAVDSTELLVEDLFASSDWHLWWWDDSGYLFRRAEGQDLKAVRPWNRKQPWTDPEAAKAQLDQMLEREPSGLALTLRAQLHSADGEDDKALALVKRALEITPYRYEAVLLHGTISFKMGNLESAERLLLLARKIAPNSPVTHFNLALLYLNTNRPSEATQELQEVLKIEPDFQQAKDLLRRL